jgi:putative hydrolase of the HAD superfamily
MTDPAPPAPAPLADRRVDVVFFDIGGVLGTNGWDREQRAAAIAEFGLDAEDFEYRHQEIVGAFESGEISLEEYLEVTVFGEARSFDRATFVEFMFSLSEPWPDSIAIARAIAERGDVRLMTLNNEAEALNRARIERFGLRGVFDAFCSSCWLRVRKPTHDIYHRALGIAQTRPEHALLIDDREQNLTPARAMGMRGIHFRGADALRADLAWYGLA